MSFPGYFGTEIIIDKSCICASYTKQKVSCKSLTKRAMSYDCYLNFQRDSFHQLPIQVLSFFIDVNAITRIHDSLTFLGATWVGHEMALYLELDQCSNSRTYQDFAPNQSLYGSPYIVKWNQTTRMKNKNG